MRTNNCYSLIRLAGLALLAGMPWSTRAELYAELPAPVAVQQCELVLEGTITSISDPVAETRRLPKIDRSGWPKPLESMPPQALRLRTCEVARKRLYKAAVPNAEKKQTFTFLVAEPGTDPAEGSGARFRTKPLKEGADYILMLRYNNDGATFYLPQYEICATPVRDAKRVFGPHPETLLDPKQWPWGESHTNGLSLALLVRDPVATGAGDERVPFLCAVRNTSATSLTLNTFAGPKPLRFAIHTASGDGEVLTPTLYRTRQPDPRSIPLIVLPPGQIAFISESGSSAWWSWLELDLAPGQYTLGAAFEVPDPTHEALRKMFVWGRVEAPPVPFRVTASRR